MSEWKRYMLNQYRSAIFVLFFLNSTVLISSSQTSLNENNQAGSIESTSISKPDHANISTNEGVLISAQREGKDMSLETISENEIPSMDTQAQPFGLTTPYEDNETLKGNSYLITNSDDTKIKNKDRFEYEDLHDFKGRIKDRLADLDFKIESLQAENNLLDKSEFRNQEMTQLRDQIDSQLKELNRLDPSAQHATKIKIEENINILEVRLNK